MKAALSILLGLLLFATVFTMVAYLVLRPENMGRIVEEADIASALDDAGIAQQIASEANRLIADRGLEKYGISYSEADGSLPVSEEDVKEFLKNDSIKAEMRKLAYDYIEAALAGDYAYHIQSNDVVSFVQAISPEVYDKFGYRLTDDDYGAIADYVGQSVDLDSYSVGSIMDAGNEAGHVQRVLFSEYPFIICVILSALFALDAIVLHRRNIRLAFLNIGVPAVVAASVYVSIGVAAGSLIGALGGESLGALSALASGVSAIAFSYGLACGGIGVALIVLNAVIHVAQGDRDPPRRTAAAMAQNAAVALVMLPINGIAIAACALFLRNIA